MYRLLVLAVALPFLGATNVGGARSMDFNYDIVAIDLAGRQTKLTQDPAFDASPAVAPDGRIVFVSTRGGDPDLYVMDRDGRNVRRLTTSATDGSGVVWNEALDLSQSSWSPRGDKIAFDGRYLARGPNCARLCADWHVLVVDSEGGRLKRIALAARAPAWSPDGRRLAYVSHMDAEQTAETLTIAHLDGTGSARVAAINGTSDVGPVWSPAGGEIAYQAQQTEGGRSWIYVVRPDARSKRRLAAGRNPTWSPDGRRLAFIDNQNRLITINRNGKRKRRVSRIGESVVDTAWSPKGDTLAFVAGTANPYGGLPRNLHLATVSANGKRLHVVARESATSLIRGRPVWTHNGKRILVAVERH